MCLEEHAKKCIRHSDYSFKSMIETQKHQSKEILHKIANRGLSRTNVAKMLEVLNFTSSAIKL